MIGVGESTLDSVPATFDGSFITAVPGPLQFLGVESKLYTACIHMHVKEGGYTKLQSHNG